MAHLARGQKTDEVTRPVAVDTLESTLIDGLFFRTLALGAVFATLAWWLFSGHLAGSILLGVVVIAFNLRVIGWVSRRMLRAGARGSHSATVWSVLLALKLLLLFVLTLVFIVFVGANAVGYVIGYSTFLLAIVWKLAPHLLNDAPTEPQGDIESL